MSTFSKLLIGITIMAFISFVAYEIIDFLIEAHEISSGTSDQY